MKNEKVEKIKKDNKKSKLNKKILESKKIIEEEKKKIRIEKKNIRDKKKEKFRKFFVSKILRIDVNKNMYSSKEIVTLFVGSFLVGIFTCIVVITILTGGRNYFKLSKDLGKFFDVYETLTDNYYDNIDKELLVEEAIDGMVSSVGDVYTSYVDTYESDEFNELVSGTYEGIGCTIQMQDDGLKVIEVFDDSPAKKAGLKAEDIILKVDDMEVNEENNAEVLSNYIKNEADEKIVMVISRNDEEKTLNIKRGKVETPVVSSVVYDKNDKKIGYIGIEIFSSVAGKQFEKELKELEKENISGLVIDVRGNNGGYLTSVTDIAQLLLPKGKIIYQVEKDEKRNVTRDKTDTSRKYPIAVLTNDNSASASEILSAAIKESYNNGYVVGTKTYGKGTVQQVKTLADGSMIKYTVENWLTPDGNWINGYGIEPTDEIVFDTKYWDDQKPENDNQLQKALDLVSK